jgi:two-component system chemotaxis sensor kinase CheA
MTTNVQQTDELLQGFLDEGIHALRGLPEHLSAFRRSPENPAPIHAVFRAIHSIKGNAGFFGLDTVKAFAHTLENTLGDIRHERLVLTEPLQRALVEGIDLLDEMLHRIQENEATNDLADREEAILAAVQAAQQPSTCEAADTSITSPSVAPIEQLPAASKGRFVRVREEHLDGFLVDVSRLFATCDRLQELHDRMKAEQLSPDITNELRQINAGFSAQTNALHSSIISVCSVPVQALFGKIPRMARTLAVSLGKQLDVVLIGEDVGIDKTLLEDLDAPLTHIVRNVCDHGIENPHERRVHGKREAGTLTLRCELSPTHVLITTQDDGRGIDPARVRRKAIEKGLITQRQAEELTDHDAIELIFHPGFSTADQITEISGRGVGMDVVRTAVRNHGGDVTVTSRVGAGTTFHLTVPIRQAMLLNPSSASTRR